MAVYGADPAVANDLHAPITFPRSKKVTLPKSETVAVKFVLCLKVAVVTLLAEVVKL